MQHFVTIIHDVILSVIPIGKLVEWLTSIAPWLIKLVADSGRAFRSDILANFTFRPIYGSYKETLFTPTGKKMKETSIIVVKPLIDLIIIKWGVSMEGILGSCLQETRLFESFEMNVLSKNPPAIEYSYLANAKGQSFYNEGLIIFGIEERGKFKHAEGHFFLPYFIRQSRQARTMRINFVWERIPSGEIRSKIGKRKLRGHADIRRFLKASN